MTALAPEDFVSHNVVILVADLAGFAMAFRSRSDQEMAALLDDYYGQAEDLIGNAGGKIVKFMGDSMLAVFEPPQAPEAVATGVLLADAVRSMAEARKVSVSLGVNIHMGPAVMAEFGHGSSRRRDVIGRTVNQTFMLGRGPGIRISERVFRTLPAAQRPPWHSNKPPAVYTLA